MNESLNEKYLLNKKLVCGICGKDMITFEYDDSAKLIVTCPENIFKGYHDELTFYYFNEYSN